LTGLWHGASWNYVLWGLYFGLLLFLNRFLIKDNLSWMPEIFKGVGTFALYLFSVVIFIFVDLDMMLIAVKSLFGLNGNAWTNTDFILTFKNNVYFIILCVLVGTPLANYPRVLLEKLSHKNNFFFAIHAFVEILIPPILLIIAANALAGNSYNPFIYFQF